MTITHFINLCRVIFCRSSTWLQAKKHNELNSSYSLAIHEIGIIKGKAEFVETEEQFSDFVMSSENAFSKEHTQWVARKVDQ
ncbi:MAG: SLATT domain-containing protein [Gammaproteobacteria bacterium]|nr:SLATT domain-containing protein [Gammaproteobacteria bacterium]